MTHTILLIGSIIAVLILLSIGTKIAWSLGIGALIILLGLFGTQGLLMIGLTSFSKGTNFTLTSLPLFLFMGEMILRSGMNEIAFDGMERFTNGIPGEILHATIGTCAAFAACCGASAACAATVASVAYPELEKRGYPISLSLGVLAAGGTLGILIPPSLGFILYGSIVGESISKLFVAGILPGIMLALMFSIYIGVMALLKPSEFPKIGKMRLFRNLYGILLMWPIGILVILVLGLIYAGIATPTEAAAIGAVGSIILAMIFQRGKFWKALNQASLGAVKTTSMIMFIVVGATVFNDGMTQLGVTHLIQNSVIHSGMSPVFVFIIVCFVYLILGMFLDGPSMLLLSLPIFYPLLMKLGFDSIWFGVIVVVLSEVSMLTPPVGFNLFVLQGMTDRSIGEVFKGAIPFVFILFFAIALLVIFPDIALWLPRLMR